MADAHWHIEPTSKCILECPLCDRTWFYDKFKKRLNHEIDIKHLQNFLSDDAYTLRLCGNNGDPIYHSKFLELCKMLKKDGHVLKITTNGSNKRESWWSDLGSILTKHDEIVFSIDGLKDTNSIYRKNSNWDSIIKGIKTIAKNNIYTEWKFIVFKHNQHQIDEAKRLSEKLGINFFRLEKSDRWLDNHDLKPDEEYIDDFFVHQEKVLKDKNYSTKIDPYCLINGVPKRLLYIDSEGFFYPCCWMGTYRYKQKSMFSPLISKYNIANFKSKDLLKNNEIIDFFTTTKDFKSAHECCKMQCGVTDG